MDITCPICNNKSYLRLIKENVEYFQCFNCKTVFSGELDNDNKIGGVAEVERNTQQNYLRIDRVKGLVHGTPLDKINVLDFGCGNGLLVEDLKKEGFNCNGYDAYNPEFQKLPEREKYHIITVIEVIEHTAAPYIEIDVMLRSLVQGGIIMIETSFVNVADEEGIPLDEFFYIAPGAGHSTIFSHHGLDLLFALKGFVPIQHWNRHVRGYIKIKK